MRYYLDVCCNDPDNGNFAGVAMQLMIGCAEFEAIAWDGLGLKCPKFQLTEQGFKMSGKHFKTLGSKDWYGNWCWNRYWMEGEELVDFVLWMWRRVNFNCSTATEEFCDWFEHADILPRTHVAAMIADLMD